MRSLSLFLVLSLAAAPLACGGDDIAGVTDNDAGGGGGGGGVDGGGGGGGDDSGTTSGDGGGTSSDGGEGGVTGKIQTVFLVIMENHSWSSIKDSSSAPWINGTLLPMSAHAEQYFTPTGNHPSEPNYIWLEAGDNLGITTDDDPNKNHQSTKEHFVTQLDTAGVSWKAYAEDISGTDCPLKSSGLYGAKHTPQLFFDDVTDTNTSTSTKCKTHIRPYTELSTDLKAGTVARYNFITPNLCNDMHGEVFGTKCNVAFADLVKKGDDWLKTEVPMILGSNAYKNGGMLIVMFDEGDEGLTGNASDGPLPFFVVSSFAKKNYGSPVRFTHSSTLRSLEKIFGVPYLRGAATSNDLSDLFTSPL